MGSLARKASIIDNENADSLDVLFFDTGDLFFIDDTKHNNDTRKIHAQIIAESYKSIGCTAIAAGERDINEFGLSYIQELIDNKHRLYNDVSNRTIDEMRGFESVICNYSNISASNGGVISAASEEENWVSVLMNNQPTQRHRKSVNSGLIRSVSLWAVLGGYFIDVSFTVGFYWIAKSAGPIRLCDSCANR